MYILDNLVFSYNWLEYILLPNMMKDDKETLKTIIKRLSEANQNAKNNKNSLKTVAKKEKKILGDIEKIGKKLKKSKAEKIQKQSNDLKKQHSEIIAEKAELDKGMMRMFDSHVNAIEDLKHSITVDFLFTQIDRKTESFSIKGYIEDVIPSRLNEIVETMENHSIDDNVKLGKRDRTKVYLQDFFNRDELLFIINDSAKSNKGHILKEQTYLARLLLTDATINMNDLLKRFEFNREYNYEHKKRMTKDGVKEWIEYSTQFSKDEQKLISFLQRLNKIQE
jgi:CRISPR-associated protein Csh1